MAAFQFQPGDWVERRQPMDGHRVGRIQRAVDDRGDAWYVRVVETGLVYIAKTADLRVADPPAEVDA